jgi:hypothetical protein
MSAISHTDWTILCDHDGCPVQLRTDVEEMRDGNASSLRRIGKRRGWAVAVPTGRERRADYCPDHRDERPE